MQELYFATEHLVQEFERQLAKGVRRDIEAHNSRTYCLGDDRLAEPDDPEDVYAIMQNDGTSDGTNQKATIKPIEGSSAKLDEATLKPEQLAK
jgi:hypothetical protein